MASRQPNFRPWKGEGYGRVNQLGLPARLLILGESHYAEEYGNRDNELTQRVVRDYLKDCDEPFFTKVLRTILGPDTAVERRDPFYNSVAFYNFVQRIVGNAPGSRPTKEMWEEAAAPFRATLECLRPTHIVTCGMWLWDHMPGNDGFWTPPPEAMISWLGSQSPMRDPKDILGCYRHSEGQSLVLAIQHPSRGPYSWYSVVKRFLNYDGSRST